MLFNKNRCCEERQMGYGMNNCCMPQCPIVEPAINKCVEREFCHEVPHVCPIHTHVINKHIYNHTYTPEY